jgi:alginate O-acetyltransferase complex protein AlgI
VLFQTTEFLVFFLALVALVGVLRNRSQRKLVLLVASYVFYMWWNPAFVVLIAFSTAVDYLVGLRMGHTADQASRKRWLCVSLVANVGLLVVFKYGNFFQHNMLAGMRLLGYEPSWTTLHIVLPVGLSFYTFQSMSYTIDVYWRKIPVTRDPLDFALFVAFFPQLIMGPIVRAAAFLPQLQAEFSLRVDREALFKILRGLFKKVVIADNLATLVQVVYADPSAHVSAVVWLAAVAFYVQLYCDFSGYSDMATGLARILGFELPKNFDWPMFATDLRAFWRQWHISLSTWFRDYLYLPLGGNRRGPWLTYRNLFLVALIAGIWHGHNWNVVIFGLLHGFGLVTHRWIADSRLAGNSRWAGNWQLKGLGWLVAQALVTLAFVFLRIEDLDRAWTVLTKLVAFDFALPRGGEGLGGLLPFPLLLLAVFFALHVCSHRVGGLDDRLARSPLYVTLPVCLLAGFALFWAWPVGEQPFIYFRF